MVTKVKYGARVALLVFYGIYALSPIYLSVASGDDDRRPDHRHAPQNFTMGIVWVNVLLSSLLEEQIGETKAPDQVSLAEQDTDLILIKKKRAVFREQYAMTPTIETVTLSFSTTDPPAVSFHEYEIPMDSQHRETDGYSSIHAGLSPPSHPS